MGAVVIASAPLGQSGRIANSTLSAAIDRKDVWSPSVTRNWWITFLIDTAEAQIVDLNYDDYNWEAVMSGTGGIRKRNPAHPGGIVKSEIDIARFKT